MNKLQQLIQSDEHRMAALRAVAELNLPDCFIAAGFVRNMVWDYFHGYQHTPLNDVDVIYFDEADDLNPKCIVEQLQQALPEVDWEVKNQAIMHRRNGDNPYSSSTDAMTYWPEKETAVGVRLSLEGIIDISAPFGLETLFSGFITYNPKRSKSVFIERVQSKEWVMNWPRLKVVS